jgi:hypothetical protein
MGPMFCPEMSVTNYQLTPRNIPEVRSPQAGLKHGESLKFQGNACFVRANNAEGRLNLE